jgi:hypothetical protein
MLGMICAAFLAGANVDGGNPDALMLSLDRLFGSPSRVRQQEFLSKTRGTL